MSRTTLNVIGSAIAAVAIFFSVIGLANNKWLQSLVDTPQPDPPAIVNSIAPDTNAEAAIMTVLRYRAPLDQSANIASLVEDFCGHSDDVGSSHIPGTIRVSMQPNGWMRVAWTLSCDDQETQGTPDQRTFTWDVSPDHSTLRPVGVAATVVSELGQ